jgi:hypothetical protein
MSGLLINRKVGYLVTWQGWDAVIVEIMDPEKRYPYRLEIQEASGKNFTVIARVDEVRDRSRDSKKYTAILAMACMSLEEEQRRVRDQALVARDSEIEFLRASLDQVEQSNAAFSSLYWLSIAGSLLAGYVLCYVMR